MEDVLNGRMPAFEICGRDEMIDLVKHIFLKSCSGCGPKDAFIAALPRIESVAKGLDSFVDWDVSGM